MEISQLLECIRERFNERSQTDPEFRKSLGGFDRTISFSLSDDADYFMSVVNGKVPSIQKGKPLSANIKITTNKKNFIGILSGQLDPMKAMLSGMIKISASIQDIAWMKKLIDKNKKDIAELVEKNK
jgi:putative sterol carrier protein